MAGQLKLAYRLVDVVDRPTERFACLRCVTNVFNPQSLKTQLQFFAGKKKEVSFQQTVYANCSAKEILNVLDVMKSVYDKVIAEQFICNLP